MLKTVGCHNCGMDVTASGESPGELDFDLLDKDWLEVNKKWFCPYCIPEISTDESSTDEYFKSVFGDLPKYDSYLRPRTLGTDFEANKSFICFLLGIVLGTIVGILLEHFFSK